MSRFQRLKFLLGGLVFGVLLNGCALTPPSSEALIFKEPEPEDSSTPYLPPPSYQPKAPEDAPGFFSSLEPIDVFFSMTARPKISGELAYAKKEFAPFIQETLADDSSFTAGDLKIRNPYYLSISLSHTILNRDNVRWAFSYGIPVIGTDFTINLAPHTYLTANVGFREGELIVQQKLHHSEHLGLAIGGYYRAERRWFEIEGDEISLVPLVPIYDLLDADRIFYNHIIGGRINGFVGGSQSRSYLLLRAAPRYAINLQKFVLNFSLSIRF